MKTTVTSPKPQGIEDSSYADALWEAALRHRRNPIVAQRLAQLEATVLLVEEDSLQDLAELKRVQEANVWNPVAGFNRGKLNTIVGSTGTGKSMVGSKMLEDFYRIYACDDIKKGQR